MCSTRRLMLNGFLVIPTCSCLTKQECFYRLNTLCFIGFKWEISGNNSFFVVQIFTLMWCSKFNWMIWWRDSQSEVTHSLLGTVAPKPGICMVYLSLKIHKHSTCHICMHASVTSSVTESPGATYSNLPIDKSFRQSSYQTLSVLVCL